MNTPSHEEQFTYLGVSVTPDAIECELDGQSYLTFNGPAGHGRLLARLGAPARSLRIICEQAEGAETRLVAALQASGFTVAIASPEEVCADACLRDASEIDARTLVAYATAHPERMQFRKGRYGPLPTVTLPRRPLPPLPLRMQARRWLILWQNKLRQTRLYRYLTQKIKKVRGVMSALLNSKNDPPRPNRQNLSKLEHHIIQ